MNYKVVWKLSYYFQISNGGSILIWKLLWGVRALSAAGLSMYRSRLLGWPGWHPHRLPWTHTDHEDQIPGRCQNNPGPCIRNFKVRELCFKVFFFSFYFNFNLFSYLKETYLCPILLGIKVNKLCCNVEHHLHNCKICIFRTFPQNHLLKVG